MIISDYADGDITVYFDNNMSLVLNIQQAKQLSNALSGALIKSLTRTTLPPPAHGCQGKRSYKTRKRAKEAHRQAGFRIRVYKCDLCGDFHACNADKVNNKNFGEF